MTVESLAVSRYMLPDWPGERYTNELVWGALGTWKVLSCTGLVLNKSGVWEHEPLPSHRTAEFCDRTLFADAEHALAVYMAARREAAALLEGEPK